MFCVRGAAREIPTVFHARAASDDGAEVCAFAENRSGMIAGVRGNANACHAPDILISDDVAQVVATADRRALRPAQHAADGMIPAHGARIQTLLDLAGACDAARLFAALRGVDDVRIVPAPQDKTAAVSAHDPGNIASIGRHCAIILAICDLFCAPRYPRDRRDAALALLPCRHAAAVDAAAHRRCVACDPSRISAFKTGTRRNINAADRNNARIFAVRNVCRSARNAARKLADALNVPLIVAVFYTSRGAGNTADIAVSADRGEIPAMYEQPLRFSRNTAHIGRSKFI